MSIVVIYHHICGDGSAAAAVAQYYFRNTTEVVEYVGLSYEGSYRGEINKTKTFYFLDIIPNNVEQIKEISENSREPPIILDHHEPNFYRLEGIKISNRSILATNMSGVGIAWMFFFGTQLPLFLYYIQERDLWKFRHPKARMFCIGFYKDTSIDYISYTNYINSTEEELDHYYNRGLEVQEEMNKEYDIIIEQGKNYRYGKDIVFLHKTYKVYMISEFSDYLHEKNSKYDFIVFYMKKKDGNYSYSLRSKKGFDCSEFCKKYGGGGHKAAAGFTSETPPNKIFSRLHNSPIKKNEHVEL